MHPHRAGVGCVCRGCHWVITIAMTMIADHANASQNAGSEGMSIDHAQSVPVAQMKLWRSQSATAAVIFARGPAGAKSWSPPSIVTIVFVTRAWDSTAA